MPKVGQVETLERVGQRLLDMKTDLKTRVWAMIETPEAIFNINALAAKAHDSETRLAGFVMGTNDLAKETRARLVPGRAPMLSWLARCLLAAHAHGIDILDGVYNDLSDAKGFEAECAQARDMGFDGKTLIHPNQIEPCNTVFSPSADEVAQARKLIAAFELPENKDKGVVQVDGRMVERMHAEMARRTVAIADAIEARKAGASNASIGFCPSIGLSDRCACGINSRGRSPACRFRRSAQPGGQSCPISAKSAGIVTQITTVKMRPDNQDEVLKLMKERARFMARQPGFVSVSLHRSEDGSHVVELRRNGPTRSGSPPRTIRRSSARSGRSSASSSRTSSRRSTTWCRSRPLDRVRPDRR